MANFDWSRYKRQDFKALQQLIELLEENDVPEETDLIDQIDLDALLEAIDTTPNAANFPLLNET